MMNRMSSEKLEKKLKMERVQICMNCKKFLNCENIGKFEECGDFDEVKDEAWVIKKI